MTPWLVLVLSLPTENATLRMRIWRALKALGCANLRDGVYLLPSNSAHETSLAALAGELTEAGGIAYIFKVIDAEADQDKFFRTLFARTEEYQRLTNAVAEFTKNIPALDVTTIRKRVKNLRREYKTIEAIDFFPDETKSAAVAALSEMEAVAMAILSPGEPQPIAVKIKALDARQYQGRLWATRRDLWVDRLASAWLVQHFIDHKARFMWLTKTKDCPADALGFDFDGATFTHIGKRVTFEVLLKSFGLEDNAALVNIAAVVHYLDVGGLPVAEAGGVEAILRGAKQRCASDDALLLAAFQIFNDLYIAYQET